LDLLGTNTARDYTLQITITHRPVFLVTLLGTGFQRRRFLRFGAHILSGCRPSHAKLCLLVSGRNLPTHQPPAQDCPTYIASAPTAQKTPLPTVYCCVYICCLAIALVLLRVYTAVAWQWVSTEPFHSNGRPFLAYMPQYYFTVFLQVLVCIATGP
jgi:hypothetical protein